MKRYNPSEIEPRWQNVWQEQRVNEVVKDDSRQKVYISAMFPYPSGAGMHTGHAFEHSIVDAIARFNRQHGKNVLNPMGWDAFGLPTENYAIKTGVSPVVATDTFVENFKKQIMRLGASIDWSREINTSDPDYYRWTQWIFTKLFERGLAYQKEALQWWCPVDKTVLANEQVEGGHCWRCGSVVEKKSMNQWFFKITDYADALLDEIPDLDWPQKIKTAQTNWIGKSQGAEIEFKIDGTEDIITVFSTRPDTLFGATFVVLSPEHPLVSSLATGDFKEGVASYVKAAVKKTEIERMSETREKTGVFTGSFALNPASGEKVPIWVADYVLSGYGTGAIMAVPAHDERDLAFAEKYRLPVVKVVEPLFVQTDTDSKVRDGEPFVERQAIAAIVKHWSEDTYIGLKWKKVDWDTIITGGIDEGQTAEEAARREIQEETGYKNLKLVRQLGNVHSKFFHVPKNENRFAHFSVFQFELTNGERDEMADEEKQIHDVVWLTRNEMEAFRLPASQRHNWNELHETASIYKAEGVLVNSGRFNGMSSSDAREEIVAWLEEQGTGRSKTTYKMRDWLISRQRYWGAPIPIIHCPEHGAVAVPEDQLPVMLPEVKDYAPKGDGKTALAGVQEWVNTTCPTCGGPALRETDTMDGYACSSWYLLRYTDPHNDTQAWDPAVANYWSPVDYYVGGDHAVAHLLYVRFWTHVFKEMGLSDFKEPVKKLIYHGYINAEDGRKMSKSLGNVIDPLDVINQGYGADALRTYLLFMGPIEFDAAWSSKGIAGVYRFLNRIWVLAQQYLKSDKEFTGNDTQLIRIKNKTIRRVTDDFHRMSFNTAISALMEYTNELYKLKIDGFSKTAWHEALVALAQLIAPFAPHMADEINKELGSDTLVQNTQWPVWDDALIVDETLTIIVQVNGKLRAKLDVATDASEDEITALALASENVTAFVGDKKPAKIIYVPGRLVNIVV